MNNHPGPIIAARDGLQVVSCEACGYAHLTEFPSPAELDKLYTSKFWQSTKAGALTDFERQAEWWAAVHNDWLSIVEAHTNRRTILDVGCGYGFFLEVASDRGWFSPMGIEPNSEARQRVNKELAYKAVFAYGETWEQWGPTKVDCISAHWLIEHLPNPLDFLLWCKSHLSPGGVLLTVIPQEWTEAQAAANEIVQKKSWHLDSTHLNYFSQTTFANLLGRAGFRIVDMLASYPMELFVTEMGSNYVDHPHLGSLCHRAVEKNELAQTRERRIDDARKRAKYGKGRDLIVVAKADL